MRVPTKKECFELLNKYEVPKSVRRHSIAVNNVAMFLGRKLKENGEKINLELLDSASLLHDIAKHIANDDESHPEVGYDFLMEEGYKEVAIVIKKHTSLPEELESREEELLWYADRRVLRDEIVTLAKRFSYLKEKYPQFYYEIKKAEPFAYQLEEEIFRKIGCSPEDLKDLAT